ncbi:MAG: YggS family pyridoxal phosphate-dependent enzyme [Peptostreptococcales bacterium]
MNSIERNLEEVKQRIEKCCNENNIKREDIILIAVTKTRTLEEINQVIQAGIMDIGENKVQEIICKKDSLISSRIHMIGHLQTNKVKSIIDKVALIHSVDSIKLAEEIDKRAGAIGKTMDILVQVNIAGEESKFGIHPRDTMGFLEALSEYPHIHVKGLMMVAPFDANPENVRPYFKGMKSLFEDMKSLKYMNITMEYLSMGMTNDYEIAIEEGSNMIRIGTAIFGARNYK